jgi:PTS system nitrogen regulatory IIA component
VFYLRTRCAIAFGAPDGKPVVHFVVIVVPAGGDVDDHLELLARVARLFSDREFRERLAVADGEPEVRRLFAAALAPEP